jgi:hypothetical protein
MVVLRQGGHEGLDGVAKNARSRGRQILDVLVQSLPAHRQRYTEDKKSLLNSHVKVAVVVVGKMLLDAQRHEVLCKGQNAFEAFLDMTLRSSAERKLQEPLTSHEAMACIIIPARTAKGSLPGNSLVLALFWRFSTSVRSM